MTIGPPVMSSRSMLYNAVAFVLLAARYSGAIPALSVLRVNETGFTHGCDGLCQMECISTINKYRENHHAPPLTFNQRLADQAQELIDKGLFKHSEWVRVKGGEAFAWGSLFPSFTAAIKSWHDEGTYFDYVTGKAKEPSQIDVRHFVQLIWKKTRKVGCARGRLYGEPWYVVHYDRAPELESEHAKDDIGQPKQDDSHWFRDASPFSTELESPKQI